MSSMDRRAAFLAGEGTLRVDEVIEWTTELAPDRASPRVPVDMDPAEPLMVAVVDEGDHLQPAGRIRLAGT